MNRYLTCCGLYCGACSSILQKEKEEGNPELEGWVGEFSEEPCSGCGAGEQQSCEFTACCREHQVLTCAFCPEFPCQKIKDFSVDEWPHHLEVLDNLFRMKEIGVEAWLVEQRQKWLCPQCGTRTHWYGANCHKCGAVWEAKYK